MAHNGVDLAIIDEAPMFPLAYIAIASMFANDLLLIGDPKQITHIDFTRGVYQNAQRLADISCEYDLQESKRCPQDATKLLQKLGYVNMTSTSKVEKSMQRVRLNDAKKLTVDAWLCFTQSAKANLARHGLSARTIHEVQGSTFRNVAVAFTRDAERLYGRQEHLRTAFSRHTNQMYVVDEDNVLVKHMPANDTQFAVCAAIAGVHNYDVLRESVHDCVTIESTERIKPTGGARHVTIGAAESAMRQFVKPTHEYGAAIRAVAHSNVPNVQKNSKAFVHESALSQPEVKLSGARIKGTASYGRNYSGRDQTQTVRTAITRYAKETKHLTPMNRELVKLDLIAGLSKFVDLTAIRVREEDIEEAMAEYILAMKERGPVDFDKDFNCEFNGKFNHFSAIKFMQKHQTKLDHTEDSLFVDKAGQGISAWTKTMNALTSAYTRAIHKAVVMAMNSGCVIANGQNEDEYDLMYRERIRQYDLTTPPNRRRKMQYVANDFSEFDSSQSEASIELDCFLLELGGAPAEVVNIYRQQRCRWALRQVNVMSLLGELKKHSGEPATLTFNTTYNMAVMGHVCKIEGHLLFAAFKGDDSLLIGESIQPQAHFGSFCKRSGIKLKYVTAPVVEFIGYIVTDHGFFPDLVRRVAKFHTARYTSNEHLKKGMAAVESVVALCRSYHDLARGLVWLSRFYGSDNYQAAHVLYDYCEGLADNPHIKLEADETFATKIWAM